MQRPVVVLPQPLSPTRPSVSPRAIVKSTPSTAFTSPTLRLNITPSVIGKCLARPRTSRSGVPPSRAAPHAATAVLARAPATSSSARKQAARWPASPARRSPAAAAAPGAALDGEAAARPEGAAAVEPRQVGRLAVDRVEARAARLVEPRHRLQQRHRVGMARVVIDRLGAARLDDAAGIHDVDPVGVARHDAEIVRDDDQRDVEPARQPLHQLEDLRLDGDVERGRRLVGDDQLGIAGERDGDHHPLAHAARELVRILLEAPRRIGDADHVQQLDRAPVGRRAVGALVLLQRLGDLPADGEHRIERGHRLLEHHADVAAADRAHLASREGSGGRGRRTGSRRR